MIAAAALMLLATQAEQEDTAKAVTQVWAACLRKATGHLAPSNEPIDTITLAVFGSCRQEERATHDAWFPLYVRTSGMEAGTDTEAAMTRMRNGFTEMIAQALVESRLPPAK